MKQYTERNHIKAAHIRVERTFVINGLYNETFVSSDIYLKDINGDIVDMIDHCIYDSRYVSGFGASDELVFWMNYTEQ